jgi:hypothetical protein
MLAAHQKWSIIASSDHLGGFSLPAPVYPTSRRVIASTVARVQPGFHPGAPVKFARRFRKMHPEYAPNEMSISELAKIAIKAGCLAPFGLRDIPDDVGKLVCPICYKALVFLTTNRAREMIAHNVLPGDTRCNRARSSISCNYYVDYRLDSAGRSRRPCATRRICTFAPTI